MSIYRELRRNRPWHWSYNYDYSYRPMSHNRYYRADSILARLERRRTRMRRNRYSVANRSRVNPRPTSRDRRHETSRLTAEDRERVETRERELNEEDEAERLKEEELAKLKEECLMVEDISLLVRENTVEHNTDMFPCTKSFKDPQLVVRRGQEFKLTLTFQRPFISKDDDMYLRFMIGEERNSRKGTYAKMKLEEGSDISYMIREEKKWGARIVSVDGNNITVAVYVPPNAIIGEWEYAIQTINTKDKEKELYECEGSEEVIVLLNPWCEDDLVYLKDPLERKEYIENECGVVFFGSYKNVQSKPWDQGQFEPGILEACLYILRKAFDFEYSPLMASPVYIARALSRILNNCDDDGVLVGRWDGKYEDGKKPLSWMGSAPIIKQYISSGQPVKYGQCWVFSHLLTTVARALGLPCRSVTNFSSAHDTNLTMTIDKYVDEEGEEIDYMNGDSVWNFHVWNEVWIKRPDLDLLTGHENKYDGWHAVDATPQEHSDSVFQCGPSPIAAIKEGDVHVGLDTKFIFGEVNAEYCTWEYNETPELLSSNSYRVGKKISTKWPNGTSVGYYFGRDDNVRLDLTDQYKYPEGSGAERQVVEKATMQGKLGKHLWVNETGVEIVIREQAELPRVGRDVTINVEVKNTTSEKENLRLRLSVRPINYWGGMIGKKKVTSKVFDYDLLGPGQSKIYEVTAEAEDIIELCDESLSMKIMAQCDVQGTGRRLFESDELVIKTPGIRCKGPEGKVNGGEPFEVEFTLKNPLKKGNLTGCKLQIEGSVVPDEGEGFEQVNSVHVKSLEDLKHGEIRTVTVKVKANVEPERSRERELNVGLETNELPDFLGNLHVELH